MYLAVAVFALIGTAFAQNCGQTPIPPNLNFKLDNEIVGGSNAVPYSWPWQCTWCRGTDTSCSLMCGCSVIDNNWVVTAAHCCQNQNAANIRVRAGVYQYANFTQGTTRRIQGNLRIHPNYNGNTLVNDICLAQLSAPLDYGDTIQPVCLPSSDDSYQQNGNNYYVTGWGTTSQGGSVSPTLRQVSVPYVDYNTCNNAYTALNYPVYQDNMLCAGVGGKDSCQGDSGVPLVYNTGSQWVQLGIVSWGYGCAVDGYPGVYARTSAFCSFISSTTNNAATCTIAGKHQ